MSPTGANESTPNKRKSVQELVDVLEKSGEKLADQWSSSVLTIAKTSSDVFVAGVQLLTDIFETGVERLGSVNPAAAKQSSAEGMTTASRIVDSQKEILAAAVRIHTQAIKQIADIAQGSLDRATKSAAPPPGPSEQA